MFDTCHSLIQTYVAFSFFFFFGWCVVTHLNRIGPCCIAAVFIVPAILPLHDLCVTASAMPVLQLPLWNICCGLGSVGLGKGRGRGGVTCLEFPPTWSYLDKLVTFTPGRFPFVNDNKGDPVYFHWCGPVYRKRRVILLRSAEKELDSILLVFRFLLCLAFLLVPSLFIIHHYF